MKEQVLQFPKDFLWGTATAAHQIEGNNVHSDWWAWEQDGRLPHKSGRACDSWKRWKEDVDLAKSLNTNAYRFSMEWARIEPEEGKFNLEALKHYEEEIKYLHKQGMQAVVTLWHFVLPKWFADKGGFTKRGNLFYFARFVGFVTSNLEESPDPWVIINEPNVYVGSCYLSGIWPPKRRRNWVNITKVFFNLVEAQRRGYTIIRERWPEAVVGDAISMPCVENFSGNPLFAVVKWWGEVYTYKFYLWLTRHYRNFIGLNYYVVHEIRWDNLLPKLPTQKDIERVFDRGGSNDLGWLIYPQGIYKLLKWLAGYRLPIYITENGIADAADVKRQAFIADHLEWIWQAISEGVDVRGYFYWTLMDNFEWAMGFEPKFGLCAIDDKTLDRKPRPSAGFYGKVARNNELVLGGSGE